MTTNKTDQLINSLTERLTPVERLASPLAIFSRWTGLSLIFLIALVFFIGVRQDLPSVLSNPVFLFEIVMAFLIFISAGLCTFYLSIPGQPHQKNILWVPIIFFAGFAGWVFYRSIFTPMTFPDYHWSHCMGFGLAMISLPLAYSIYQTKKGASTRPYLLTLMMALSAGALGYIGLRFICHLDGIGASFYQHVFLFVIIGALLGLAARKILRW